MSNLSRAACGHQRWILLALGASAALSAADPLVVNGELETADPTDATRALSWDRPDGLGIQWLTAPGSEHGRALRFDTNVTEQQMMAQWQKMGITDWTIPAASNEPVGATYGLSLYSATFAITAGQPYKVLVDHCGEGGGKIWVRGYVEKKGRKGRVYEAVAETSPSRDWRAITYVFHPTKTHPKAPNQPKPTEMKVMLFAYWPAGVSWFDNIRVETATEEELALEEARKPGK